MSYANAYYGGNQMGVPYNNGYGYSLHPQQENIIMNQTLTKEEVSKLRNGNKGFRLSVTEDDCLREMCSHKDPETHNMTLVDNHDGTVTCNICGSRFSLVDDLSDEQVQDATDEIYDIIQTAKTNFGPVPIEAGRALYRSFAFIKKIPEFYSVARNYRNKWANAGYNLEQNNGGGAWANANMLMNPMYSMMPGQMGGYGAPPMNMGQPMGGYAQPQMTPQPNVMPGAPVMQPGQTVQGSMMGGYNPMMGGQAQNVDRPVGIVEPAPQAGPSPMAAPSTAATTADVSKSFKG